jgi:hypothetical protein
VSYEEVYELLAVALREDTIVGSGGRATMRWTGVARVLLAKDRLAVLIAEDIERESEPLEPGQHFGSACL